MENKERRSLKTRIFAFALAIVMTLSMSAFAYAEDFAEGSEPVAGQSELEQVGEGEAEQVPGTVQDEAQVVETTPEEVVTETEGETEATANELPSAEDGQTDGEAATEEPIPEEPVEITLRIKGENRTINVNWDAVEDAAYYALSLDNGAQININANDAAKGYTFNKVDPKVKHSLNFKAFGNPDADEGGEDILIAEKTVDDISAEVTAATKRRTVSGAGRSPRYLGFNLKQMAGETWNGYSVVQGGTTDGTYSYQLMVSKFNQNGRVLKYRISDNRMMAVSRPIDIAHGNGMTYDSLRNRLVVVGAGQYRNRLTVIDAGKNGSDTPAYVQHAYINYGNSSAYTSDKSYFDSRGVSGIAYIEKYDCYVAMQRSTHDLLVLDPQFRVIGFIGTKISAKYPGTYQALDGDERYIYIVMSSSQTNYRAQPHNIILAMEWHGEKMVDYANGKVSYVNSGWKCGSNGAPSAVIRTNNPYENENIFHVDLPDGSAHFYLAAHWNNPQYKTVIKKKKVKVKWKKVRKWYNKKTKKWTRKKPKKKYRGKSKKVWIYKKKTKKIRKKVFTHYNREGYVYDLGVF